jgi:hypothetical protein
MNSDVLISLALQPVSFNVNQTPPRRSVDGTQAAKPPLIFDNFDQFFSLLRLSIPQLELCILCGLTSCLNRTRHPDSWSPISGVTEGSFA